MNTYPDLGIAYGAGPERDHGIRTTTTKAGTIRTRVMFEAPVFTLEVQHPYLTPAEAGAVDDFYAANAGIDFLYVYPFGTAGPETYKMRFSAPPVIRRRAPEYYTASVNMVGVSA